MNAKEDYAIRQSDAAVVAGFERLSGMILDRTSYEALQLADSLIWTVSNAVYDCFVGSRKPGYSDRKFVRDICDKLSQEPGIGDGRAVKALIYWAEKTLEECDGTE